MHIVVLHVNSMPLHVNNMSSLCISLKIVDYTGYIYQDIYHLSPNGTCYFCAYSLKISLTIQYDI